MDPWSFLPGWLEKLIGARARQTATDLGIADRALLLRRQLAASFADWPQGPANLDELTLWARNAANGFDRTEAALRELVDLRPEASRRVKKAVGRARDCYYEAANLINPVFRRGAVEAQLRGAYEHFRRCLEALDALRVGKD